MGAVRDDTIGAFNTLIEDLRAQDGRTFLSLTQFDSEAIELVVDAQPIEQVAPLTRETFQPRGGTPLLDAVGITLTRMEQRVRDEAWTGKVLVVIITDGHENQSREWTRDGVLKLIATLEAGAWAFTYLGASPESIEEAVKMGIARGSSAVWRQRGKNVGAAGKSIAGQASRYRSGMYDKRRLILDEERRRMTED